MSLKKSMDIDYRKLFSFAMLFMFMFVFSFVMAADGDGAASDEGATNTDFNIGGFFQNTDGEGMLSGVGGFFDDWKNADVSNGIAKYLFWALITMLVMSVASKIPGLQNLFVKNGKTSFLGVLFSLIIGFLAMWAIPPAQIGSMMLSYGAMGFVMGAFLPFIILMFFTINLASNPSNNATQTMASRFIAMGIWIAFDIWLIGRVGGARAAGQSIGLEALIVIAAIAVTVAMGTIFKVVRKMLKLEIVNVAKDQAEFARMGRKMNADDAKAAAGVKPESS